MTLLSATETARGLPYPALADALAAALKHRAALTAPEPWLTQGFHSALGALGPAAGTHGDFPAGLPALRRALADRYTARGVPTMPEQIMVTTGAMGAVAAICRMFTPAGERVAVEHPSYANVLQLMREAGVRLVPVPMLDNGLGGWDLAGWRRVLRAGVDPRDERELRRAVDALLEGQPFASPAPPAL